MHGWLTEKFRGGRETVLTMAYSTFPTGFVAASIIYPATSSTFKRLSAEKRPTFQ